MKSKSKKVSKVDVGNLYQMNKSVIAQTEHGLDTKELSEVVENTVIPYLKNHKNYRYFMLLCHDERDYTVFHVFGDNHEDIAPELVECLTNRGSVYSIELDHPNQTALEIWVEEQDKNLVCFYFFPYDAAVIEIKEK